MHVEEDVVGIPVVPSHLVLSRYQDGRTRSFTILTQGHVQTKEVLCILYKMYMCVCMYV